MTRTVMITVAAALVAGGCQRIDQHYTDTAIKNDVVALDPAMAARADNWQSVTVEYASGDIVAGPTLFPYEPDPDRAQWQQALISPALFLGQAIASPIMAFVAPVWGDVRYTAVEIPPTHTAMPPLPPTDEATLQTLRDQHAAAVDRQRAINEAQRLETSRRQVQQSTREVLRPLPGEQPVEPRTPRTPAPQPAPAPAVVPPAPAPQAPPAPRIVQPAPQTRPAAPAEPQASPSTRPAPATRPAELNK